jgi:hypothetical protein
LIQASDHLPESLAFVATHVHEPQTDRFRSQGPNHRRVDQQRRLIIGDLHEQTKQAPHEELAVGLERASAHGDIADDPIALLVSAGKDCGESGDGPMIFPAIGRVSSAEVAEALRAELTAERLKKQQQEQEIEDSSGTGAANIVCATGRAQWVHQRLVSSVRFSATRCWSRIGWMHAGE